MNCEQIKKKLDLRTVLESFNIFPIKEKNRTGLYFALDRKEKIPSFSVDFIKNKAFDFGTGKNYDIISIVQTINKCSVQDSLKYLEKLNPSSYKVMYTTDKKVENYNITKIDAIRHKALVKYLELRHVMKQNHLVKEIHYNLNGKKYFGIGFFNDSGGLEIRNKYLKICLGKKDVTFIKNESGVNNEVCVFEGFFDYLTFKNLVDKNKLTTDYLILNSTAMYFKVEKQLSAYKKINLFLDNDLSGKLLTEQILNVYDNIEDCSVLYKNFKDLNEWYISF